MSNYEVLDAESKDISSRIKHILKKKLKSRILTVTATIIITLGAFQNISAQSHPDTRTVSQKIAQAITDTEFTSKSVEDQIILMIKWVEALSDKIQQQFSEYLKKGELIDAEKELEFYKVIAKRTGDSNTAALVEQLQSELEKEKNIKNVNQKDILNKIINNKIETGSIQEIDGRLYATFTSSYKSEGNARDAASMGLNNFMRKNNLKTDANQYSYKILPQYGAYTVTAYVIINN